MGHTDQMRALAKTCRPMLWVIAFVLILVRTGDAHVHLCFDGQEPPSTLHAADDRGIHHDEQSAHVDADVNAVDTATFKKDAPSDQASPISVASFVLLLLPPDGGIPPPATTENPAPPRPYLFLPHLRGPPA